jgi:hypothetical protein
MNAAPLLFQDFSPGSEMGEHVELYDESAARLWRTVFEAGAGSPAEQLGVATALMMRGYLAVVQPRPPGNVHARQQLQVSALPHIGEAIRMRVRCAGKEIRRERRYVQIAVDGTGDGGRALFSGSLSLVWAA